MKQKLSIIAGACALFAACTVQAADNSPYFSASVGMSSLNDATLTDAGVSVDTGFNTGVSLAAAAGYAFDAARAELELAYRKNAIDSFTFAGTSVAGSGDVTGKSIMANLYYDFSPAAQWSPFIGVGAGLTKVEVEDAAVLGTIIGGADDTVFSWQMTAGVSCKITEASSLDLSYRYFNAADPDFQGINAEYSGHNLMAGLRISY